MNRAVLTIFVLAVLGTGIACSKSPKQYQTQTPDQGKVDPSRLTLEQLIGPPSSPSAGLLAGERGEETQEEMDARVRQNSMLPIVLGEGAAGVTLTTTYEEAEFRLSKGRLTSLGCLYYREGLCILWRPDQPRTPVGMIIVGGYLGPVNLPAPYGAVKIGTELAQHFGTGPIDKDPKAQAFIEAIYRQIKNEGANSNCLADQTCYITAAEDNKSFDFNMPGVTMRFSNDSRKALGTIIIQVSSEPMGLEGRVELLKGEIEVLGAQGETLDRIALGTTFSEVLAKSGLEDDKRYVVGTRIFGKALRGMAIIFLRDKFGKDDRQPEADDPLVNVSFDTEFQGQFRMNGKKIVVQPRAGDQVQIKLADESGSPAEGTYIIGENQKIFPGDAKKQLALIKSLVQFTEQEMNKEKSDDEIIISMIEGAHENRPGRSLGGGVIRYNQKTGWGFSLGYNMDEQSGLLSIGYGMIDSDFERLAIEEGQKVWMAGSQRLAGVGLGEIVYIKDKDEERQTATLRYQHPTRGWMEMRVNYNPNGEQPVMYREGSETKVYYQPMFLIKAGSIINIGGQPLGTTDIGGVQHDAFEITVLASDMMFNSVVGLCEIPGFALPFGAYDLDVFGATNSGSVVESIPSAIKRADESKQVAQLRRKLEKETGELLSDLRGLEVPEPMSTTTNARRRALMERLEQIRKQADEKGWIERLDNPSMSVIQWRFKKLSDEDLALEDKFLALKSCIFEAPVDSAAQGLRSAVYFPRQTTQLSFVSRELDKVIIYKKPDPSALEKVLRGGGQ